MKEIALTIGERVAAVKLYDEFKGSTSQLAMILEDVKGFVVKPEEWEAANLTKRPNADGSEAWHWNDEGSEQPVSVSKDSVDYLCAKIKAKSEAGELTLIDRPLISLEKKLT